MTDPADRIAERLAAIKAGDPSEQIIDPERDERRARAEQRRHEQVNPIPKGSAREPRQRREHPIQPVSNIEPANEGSTSTMPTKTKARTRKTTKRAAPPKAAAATNGEALDTRALPWSIVWSNADKTFGGQSLTGDWGNARYRIKAHLDKAHTPAEVRDALTFALDHVRLGKKCKVHDVEINCIKR